MTRRLGTFVWDRLYRLKQRGVTLVLTTHCMDEAEQLCDRLVVMDKAKIVAQGSPRELVERYSTREVLELRFPVGVQETLDGVLDGLARAASSTFPTELLYRRMAIASPRRSTSAGSPRRACWSVGARARRRLPSADRPDAHRMTAAVTAPVVEARVARWPWLRVFEHQVLVYRRTWRGSLFSGFLTPVLFMTAMGVGLGTLVNANNPNGVGGQVPGVPGSRPAGRDRDADGVVRVHLSDHGRHDLAQDL